MSDKVLFITIFYICNILKPLPLQVLQLKRKIFIDLLYVVNDTYMTIPPNDYK